MILIAIGIVLYGAFVINDLSDKKKRRAAVRATNQKADQYNQSLQEKMGVRAAVLSQQIVTARNTLAATRQLLLQYYRRDLSQVSKPGRRFHAV